MRQRQTRLVDAASRPSTRDPNRLRAAPSARRVSRPMLRSISSNASSISRRASLRVSSPPRHSRNPADPAAPSDATDTDARTQPRSACRAAPRDARIASSTRSRGELELLPIATYAGRQSVLIVQLRAAPPRRRRRRRRPGAGAPSAGGGSGGSRLHQRDPLLLRQHLNLGPPLRELRIRDADLRAQQQEIVGRAKTRMLQQAQAI